MKKTKSAESSTSPTLLAKPRLHVEGELRGRKEAGNQLLLATVDAQEFLRLADLWDDYNRALLQKLFTSDEMAKKYAGDTRRFSFAMNASPEERLEEKVEELGWGLQSIDQILNRVKLMDEVVGPTPVPSQPRPSPLEKLVRLLTRFHSVQKQLRKRQRKRKPFVEGIQDEYDVQDLLYGLLRGDVDDIRPEDWVPSYAGSNSRVDFVLKNEQIVLEAKFATDSVRDKELGEQLIIDIARYKQHVDCKTLVCFIYDPDGHVGNPDGLTADLETLSQSGMKVVVVINPRN